MNGTSSLEELLLVKIGAKVEAKGFKARARAQAFVRRTDFGHEILHVAYFAQHGRTFSATQDVALRFNDVEEIAMADEPLMSRIEKKTTATLGCELGNLIGGKQMVWHDLGSEAEVCRAAEEMFAVFVKFALPYFERYCDREQVLAVLSGDGAEARLQSPSLVGRAKRAIALTLLLRGEEEARRLGAAKLVRVQEADARQLGQLQEFIGALDQKHWQLG